MIRTLFNTLIHDPLYNGIIFLLSVVPGIDLGVAVILFTVLVRLIIFPLSQTAVRTQLKMKALEPEINALKEKHKDDKQIQAQELMGLYRRERLNPFSSVLLLFVQLPIIFGLYFIFLRGGFPMIDMTTLYAFTPIPATIKTTFLGLFEVTERSVIVALLTAGTQYLQARFSSVAKPPAKKDGEKPSFAQDMARGMHVQMKYVFPVIVGFISYTLPAMIGLYWMTSNVFTIGQEIYVRRKFGKQQKKENEK